VGLTAWSANPSLVTMVKQCLLSLSLSLSLSPQHGLLVQTAEMCLWIPARGFLVLSKRGSLLYCGHYHHHSPLAAASRMRSYLKLSASLGVQLSVCVIE
jgi:hypothetical protein